MLKTLVSVRDSAVHANGGASLKQLVPSATSITETNVSSNWSLKLGDDKLCAVVGIDRCCGALLRLRPSASVRCHS